MRVAFLFNAQSHHLLHSLPTACELSRLNPEIEVVVVARSEEQLALARDFAAAYPGHRLQFELLHVPALMASLRHVLPLPKIAILMANRHMLSAFDALVVPERTTLLLKRMGVSRPKYIHSFHGPSGHDRIDDPRMREFDLLLAPAARKLERLVEAGSVKSGHAAVTGYAKFDLVRRLGATRPPLFANGRPTVVYNPHHWSHKSSWHVIGRQVLDYFARSDTHNLIFAPHVRLFDPPERKYEAFKDYLGLDHIRIDLGSLASIDMSYTLAADIYLGDVSSQVFEFTIRPRPCIFLNPRRLKWQDDPDFASWGLGQVVETIESMDTALKTVDAWQPGYAERQRDTFAQIFPEFDTPAPQRAAQAIAEFLREGRLDDSWQTGLGQLT